MVEDDVEVSEEDFRDLMVRDAKALVRDAQALPLSLSSLPFPISDTPQEMILDLALNIEPLDRVAARYDMTLDELKHLTAIPQIDALVTQRRKQLESEGFNFKSKAAMLAEDMMIDVYRAAKASDGVGAKLDVAKFLTKVADLEPRAGDAGPQGAGFSIVIKVGGQDVVIGQQKVLEIEADEVEGLGPAPEYLKNV